VKRSGDRVIGGSGDRTQNLTTEARRHGESGKRIIRLSKIPSPVILSGAPRKILPRAGDGRGVEGSRECLASRYSAKAFSRELPEASSARHAASGFLRLTSQDRLFDSPSSRETELRLAQDDSGRGDRLGKQSLPAPGAFQRVANHARDICQLLLTTLREIFDENAYERFLRRRQISRSVESYRAFLLEREEGTARKPRCC